MCSGRSCIHSSRNQEIDHTFLRNHLQLLVESSSVNQRRFQEKRQGFYRSWLHYNAKKEYTTINRGNEDLFSGCPRLGVQRFKCCYEKMSLASSLTSSCLYESELQDEDQLEHVIVENLEGPRHYARDFMRRRVHP